MRLLKKTDRPEQKVGGITLEPSLFKLFLHSCPGFEVVYVFCHLQYTIAMMGYADEHETIVLELTYNYGVTEYSKGNAYAQVS